MEATRVSEGSMSGHEALLPPLEAKALALAEAWDERTDDGVMRELARRGYTLEEHRAITAWLARLVYGLSMEDPDGTCVTQKLCDGLERWLVVVDDIRAERQRDLRRTPFVRRRKRGR